MDTLIWRGASDAQQNPVKCRNQQREGNTSHQTDKNPGSNSDLPQEAEGEPDHLPMGHPSNHQFLVETMSLRFREQY
jgi:hypothetical protein